MQGISFLSLPVLELLSLTASARALLFSPSLPIVLKTMRKACGGGSETIAFFLLLLRRGHLKMIKLRVILPASRPQQFHAAIFSHGFLSRHAQLTKQKRDHS